MPHTLLLACAFSLACSSDALLETQEVAATLADSRTQPRDVAILIYEGVELLDFAGPGEAFSAARSASGRAFRVFTVAKTKETVTSQGFVDITPRYSIADCPAPDVLVVPGGDVPDGDRELQAWVQRCAASGELVMSVCNGAFLLAEAGLLDGLEVTTHHGSLEALSASYPKARVFNNRRFVDSGRVMTCAGVSAGIDGALHVIERFHGEEAARHTARYMEYDWRPAEIAAQLAEPGRTIEDSAGAELAAIVRSKGLGAALAAYRAMPSRAVEEQLDSDGHALMRLKKVSEARALFELVAAAFPDSANALDSLSQACEALGDQAAAIRHAEEALAKLETPGLEPARAKTIENSAASRLVRLGKGEKSSLRFACPPCGGGCDELRYLAGGPCPGCHMGMVAVNAGG